MAVRRHGRGIKDQRRAARIEAQALTAFYWTGGPPKPYRIRDISGNGAFIETEDQWSLGALIHLVLKRDGSTEPPDLGEENFSIWAHIVRIEPGGMAVQFVAKSRQERKELKQFVEGVVGKFKA